MDLITEVPKEKLGGSRERAQARDEERERSCGLAERILGGQNRLAGTLLALYDDHRDGVERCVECLDVLWARDQWRGQLGKTARNRRGSKFQGPCIFLQFFIDKRVDPI